MDIRTTAARITSRLGSSEFTRRAEASEASLGFHDSSFDLRRGLDVCEAPVALMPEEILREFHRQMAH
jgi:hypothetical protein